MPVRVKYSSMITKQCYRYDDEKNGKPYFNEDVIGVEFYYYLYAETKEVAYDVIAKWTNDPSRTYSIKEVMKVTHREIPRDTFFYETEHYGRRLDMEK